MKDFALQGKIWLGQNIGGKPQAMNWCGDAKLSVKASAKEETRKESYSGKRNTSATMATGTEVTFTLTLYHATKRNLALGLYGGVNEVSSGSATDEVLPAGLVAGDSVILDRGDISSLVIEDNAGTPVTLTLNTHYKINDAIGGVVDILDPAALTQPFSASYDYGASTDVTMFTEQPPVRYLMMTGQNTIDGSSEKIRLRLYRCKFNPVSQLELISEKMAEMELTGTCLLDSDNEANTALGGFGRFEELTDAA